MLPNALRPHPKSLALTPSSIGDSPRGLNIAAHRRGGFTITFNSNLCALESAVAHFAIRASLTSRRAEPATFAKVRPPESGTVPTARPHAIGSDGRLDRQERQVIGIQKKQ